MATGSVKITRNDVEMIYSKLLDLSRIPLAASARDLIPMYINAQVKRWESENSTETGQWIPLDAQYARYKTTRFASYPEAGERMLVATGDLLKAVTLQGGDRNQGVYLPEPGRFHVQIISDYASYVDEKRSFSDFGDETIQAMANKVMEYLD